MQSVIRRLGFDVAEHVYEYDGTSFNCVWKRKVSKIALEGRGGYLSISFTWWLIENGLCCVLEVIMKLSWLSLGTIF